MMRKISEVRDSVIGKLNGMVRSTESIYLHLGNLYPEIVSEMNASLEESERALVSLREGGGSSIETFLSSVVRGIGDFIKRLKAVFAEMRTRDDDTMKTLNEVIGRLSSLDGSIERIEEDSEAMELISLNAMTAALKAGLIGKAFSVITDDLKRLSERTIRLTGSLTAEGKQLLKAFNDLKESLETAERFRFGIISKLDQRLSDSYQSVESGMSEIAGFFGKLVSESQSIKIPVSAIMEEIQLQDLIKQSTDHVILALRELSDVDGGADGISRLDAWSFNRILTDLCRSVLRDVDSRLAESIGSFSREIDSITDLVEKGDAERSRFAANYGISREGTDDRSSFAERLEYSSATVNGVMADAAKYMDLMGKIRVRSENLARSVEDLEGRFKSFSQIVSRFQCINVAARIEAAKRRGLTGVRDSVAEMSSLTDRIEGDIGRALEATKSFIRDTRETVRNFTKQFSSERKTLDDAETDFRLSCGDVAEIRLSIQRRIEGISIYSKRFVELIAASKTDLENLVGLRAGIASIDEELDAFRQEVVNAIRDSGSEARDGEYDIRNERLKELIRRFTILTHKKTAGDLANFEVEGGVASGEVTFF